MVTSPVRVAADRIGRIDQQVLRGNQRRPLAITLVRLHGSDRIAQDRRVLLQRIAQDLHDLGALCRGELAGPGGKAEQAGGQTRQQQTENVGHADACSASVPPMSSSGLRPGPHRGRCPLDSRQGRSPWDPSLWSGAGWGCPVVAIADDRTPPPRTGPERMDCKGSAFAGGPGGKAPWRLPLRRNASMARSLTRMTWTSTQLTQVRRGMAGGGRWLRACSLLALALAGSACSTVSSVTESVFGPSTAPQAGAAWIREGLSRRRGGG